MSLFDGHDQITPERVFSQSFKRELFAVLAMQGMMSNPALLSMSKDSLVEASVAAAEMLLERLNK